jgi:hypothetical protein
MSLFLYYDMLEILFYCANFPPKPKLCCADLYFPRPRSLPLSAAKGGGLLVLDFLRVPFVSSVVALMFWLRLCCTVVKEFSESPERIYRDTCGPRYKLGFYGMV